MFKRILILFTLGLLWALPAAADPAPAVAESKTYSAESFDVDWILTENGDLEVTETVVFRFEGGPFTYVYRELPQDYSDGVQVVETSLDGKVLPAGEAAGQVETERGDPLKVTWHLEPTSNAAHAFQLKYRVRGLVRQENGADLFWWNALPTDYEYPIQSATVRLSYPPSLKPSGPPEVRRGTAQVSQADGQVIWTAQNVKPGAPLTLAVPFPPGSLISGPPEWQARANAARAAMPGFLAAAGLALLAGLLALWVLWSRARRPESAVGPAPAPSPTLPDGLPPALAGALLTANGRATATQAVGTLFDLAQRGILTIEESLEKRWYRQHDFDIRLVRRETTNMRPHEQGLLALVFTEKSGPTDVAKMSEVGSRLATRLKQFATAVDDELGEARLIDPERQATAKRFMILGVALLILMVPLVAVALLVIRSSGGWPFLFTGVAFVLAMTAFIMSAAHSPLSDEGARAAARWKSFQEYLKRVSKGREPAWDVDMFERYLPYAAAFGIAEGWAKAFQQRGGTVAPAWFRSLATSADDGSLALFIAMTTSAHTAGASGGGGGAGGGGSSGAG